MTNKEKLQRIHSKFVTDPDWILVEEMINEYIEPLRDINTIDLTGSADSVMADVAGRVKAYNAMTKFLRDCRILGKINNVTSSMK